MQHCPHLVATRGQAAMVVLHLREITVGPSTADEARWNALACSAAHAFQPLSTSGLSCRVHGCRSKASSTAWSTSAIWLLALDSACGAVVLASTSVAATRLQPTGSISGSWPSASSPGERSATKNRPGPRCRQVARGLCLRCLFSPAVRWARSNVSIAFEFGSQLLLNLLRCLDVSNSLAARDAGCVRNWRGAASRHFPPPASD